MLASRHCHVLVYIDMTKHWLMKSEPSVFSFENLKTSPGRREPWDGVRNYQARNFMMKEMAVGDKVLFYHSNCKDIGVAGLAKVASEAYPDPTQFDRKSDYYDPKSSKDNPRWFLVDIVWFKDIKRLLSLSEIKKAKGLENMLLVQKGQRLSIQPVTRDEFDTILRL